MVSHLISKKYYVLNKTIASEQITRRLAQIHGVVAVRIDGKDKCVQIDFYGQIEEEILAALEDSAYMVSKIENALGE